MFKKYLKALSMLMPLLVIAACNSSDGSGGGGSTSSSTEAEIVTGALFSEINTSMTLDNPLNSLEANFFSGQQSSLCPTIKTFYDTYMSGCAHSCSSEVLNRDCSNKTQTASCNGKNLTVNYTQHLMKWDMSNLDSSYQGTHIFTIETAGNASDGSTDVTFDCDMTIRATSGVANQTLTCGTSDFDLACVIDGQSYTCEELLDEANQSKQCASS